MRALTLRYGLRVSRSSPEVLLQWGDEQTMGSFAIVLLPSGFSNPRRKSSCIWDYHVSTPRQGSTTYRTVPCIRPWRVARLPSSVALELRVPRSATSSALAQRSVQPSMYVR